MVDHSGDSLKITLLEKKSFVRFTDVFAGGFWTMARSEGNIFFVLYIGKF